MHFCFHGLVCLLTLTFTAHVIVCIKIERRKKEHTTLTIKGFQENIQQSECFAAVAKKKKKCFETKKICNIFEPL